ncbi:MAG: MoxR family ATPase [Acutalibacteraceae bacterium]|nr:MoxR family ATPase [Clostridia bacterium]MEE3450768.1 MoxR family ATPase [Acutalibacteraceae bacterium]
MDKQIELLIDNISSVIIGKQQAIINVIAAMLSEGHILIEDVPGVGKTRLISSLASSVDGKFNRIQLTPDIMPSDIVGFSMINPQTRALEYKSGAAMCNFLLADEINRASPKSQSSLLEVMEERQISLDGKTMPLPLPFMVLATQNPVETYGTYHLPEAQMDRFIMKISMGYPSVEDELNIITQSETKTFAQKPKAVMTTEDVKNHIEKVKQVTCRDNVKMYIVDLLNATRSSQLVKLGASPRAGIALLRASKAIAYINGRDYVTPDDVKTMTLPVLSHRLMLSPKGKSAYPSSEAVMSEIASTVSVPLK